MLQAGAQIGFMALPLEEGEKKGNRLKKEGSQPTDGTSRQGTWRGSRRRGSNGRPSALGNAALAWEKNGENMSPAEPGRITPESHRARKSSRSVSSKGIGRTQL